MGRKNKGQTPYEIGRTGTVEQLRQANEAALRHADHDGWHRGYSDQQSLQDGAIKAFNEDRPANLQVILSAPKEFAKKNGYSTIDEVDCEKILFQLMEESADPVDVINRAMGEMPPQRKLEFLNNALLKTVSDISAKTESFLADLLKARLEVNPELGNAALLLASAAHAGQPLPVIELLLENGAEFKAARFLMDTKKWGQASLNSLEAYRRAIMGEPDPAETVQPVPANADTNALLRLILEQVTEITAIERRREARELAAVANLPQAAEPAPQEKAVATQRGLRLASAAARTHQL